MSKPTIVFVPGAWHPGSAYHGVVSAMTKLGYPVDLVQALPSLDVKPANKPEDATCGQDADHVRNNHLQPLLAQGKDIILMAHSYGAVPGSCAVTGLSKRSRSSEGLPGGVVGIILVSGFAIPEGVSLFDASGGTLSQNIDFDKPSPGLCLPKDPVNLFVKGVPAEMAKENLDALLPHASSAFMTPQPKPAWADSGFEGRLAYILCLEEFQEFDPMAMGMLAGTGVEWRIRKLQSSHNGFTHHMADETAGLVDGLVGEMTAVK